VNLVSALLPQVDSVLPADGWRPARQIRIVPRIWRINPVGRSGVQRLENYFPLGIGVVQPAMSEGLIPWT
jgi:hypothetical protein